MQLHVTRTEAYWPRNVKNVFHEDEKYRHEGRKSVYVCLLNTVMYWDKLPNYEFWLFFLSTHWAKLFWIWICESESVSVLYGFGFSVHPNCSWWVISNLPNGCKQIRFVLLKSCWNNIFRQVGMTQWKDKASRFCRFCSVCKLCLGCDP